MKPDWKDSPEWANYLAMDEDGSWYWHKTKPMMSGFDWASPSFASADTQIHWENSLEERPNE